MKLYGPRFFRFALPIQQYKVGTPQLMGRLRCGGVKCGYPHVFKDMPCVGREDQIPCRERVSRGRPFCQQWRDKSNCRAAPLSFLKYILHKPTPAPLEYFTIHPRLFILWRHPTEGPRLVNVICLLSLQKPTDSAL